MPKIIFSIFICDSSTKLDYFTIQIRDNSKYEELVQKQGVEGCQKYHGVMYG